MLYCAGSHSCFRQFFNPACTKRVSLQNVGHYKEEEEEEEEEEEALVVWVPM